jgi:thioesterase domain-containing protein
LTLSSLIIVLPGAGGGTIDPAIFSAGPCEKMRVHSIDYPGWQRYVADGFSAEDLITDLAAQIVARVPEGPIQIVGNSIGGHFGYAVALRLQAAGREIAGVCAIDSFMILSAAPSAGWQTRALDQALELLRQRRIEAFTRFLRSLFWRALLRLARGRLPTLLMRVTSGDRLPSVSALDPIFEKELSMRLLIRATGPWIAALDREPVALKAPALLLRTRLTAGDDVAWRRRCPNIEIIEIPGRHHTLFAPANIGALRAAFATGTSKWSGAKAQ